MTATRVEADLGALGQVALDVAPAGRKKTLRSRCGDVSDSFTFEPQVYSGNPGCWHEGEGRYRC